MKKIFTILLAAFIAMTSFDVLASDICKDKGITESLRQNITRFGYPCSEIFYCTAGANVVLSCQESKNNAMFSFREKAGQMLMQVKTMGRSGYTPSDCYVLNTGQGKPVSYCNY